MRRILLTLSITLLAMIGLAQNQPKEIFEVRIYHGLSTEKSLLLDQFMSNAFIPAYNKFGVKVGAWQEFGKPDSPDRYFLLIYKDIDAFQKVKNEIWSDKTFAEKSTNYFAETAESPAYYRFDSYLCEGFDNYPQAVVPAEHKGIYEMRIYNSPNEEALQRKMHMFNNGEIDIFRNAGVNCLFFGEVLAGTEMPVLIYMTWYNSMDERNTNWGKFSGSDAWANMKKNTFYNHATSKTRNIFLSPMSYSQF